MNAKKSRHSNHRVQDVATSVAALAWSSGAWGHSLDLGFDILTKVSIIVK